LGRDALKAMGEQRRVEGVSIRLKSKNGPTPAFSLAGYRIGDMKAHFFLCLKINEQQLGMTITRDEKTGLISEDSFPDIAAEKLNALRA
jgi:hypothetical protein